MVRAALALALLAASHGSAQAQAADWRAAGGPLFAPAPAGPEPVPAAAREPAEPAAALTDPPPFARPVRAAATRYGLDPMLLHAIVAVESGYRPDAVSPAGAGGLVQLMPATAAGLGVRDRFDPAENLMGGAAYLAQQLRRFGDLELALAAYNAGPARVAARGRTPDLPETRRYVRAVVDCFLALAAGRRVRGAQDCRRGGPAP